MQKRWLLLALLPLLLLGLVWPTANAFAALPQLSFDNGASILRNPSDDQLVLRSANIDQVQLTLYRVAQPELLNQIAAARATQSVTEEGMRDRVLAEAPAAWRMRFVLGNNATPLPLSIPLSVVTGTLQPGVYMLVARALAPATETGQNATPVALPAVVQWFHVGNLAVHTAATEFGQLVMTTHRAAAVPVGLTRLTLLNNKGQPVDGAPRDWRTDASGAVFWSGAWPADAVLLRADDEAGNTALLPLTEADKQAATKAKGAGLRIMPGFAGNSVPSGATAIFDIAAVDANGQLVQDSMRYEFARITNSYRWVQDGENLWQSKIIARPTVIERGVLRSNRGAAAGRPVRLMLAVTEGRFRLTVSTPDGAMRQSYEFTAGWWRALPVDENDGLSVVAKLLSPTQLEITAPDRAETGASRWAVVWRADGPETRTSSAPLLELPTDRLAEPLIAGLCVPGRGDAAAVVCAATVVTQAPAKQK